MLNDLRGVIPPATTPFSRDGDVDLGAMKEQVDWLIDQGAHGIAVGGSTGEGHTIDVDEFRGLVDTALDAAAGRVPAVAGIIVDSTRGRRPKGAGHRGPGRGGVAGDPGPLPLSPGR